MEVARRSQTNKAEMYRKAEEVGKIPNLSRSVKLFSEQEEIRSGDRRKNAENIERRWLITLDS